MPIDILADPLGERHCQSLTGCLDMKWGSTAYISMALEAFKPVLRDTCLGLTCGVRQRLQAKLCDEEAVLPNITGGYYNLSRNPHEEHSVRQHIVDIWDQLDKYTLKQYWKALSLDTAQGAHTTQKAEGSRMSGQALSAWWFRMRPYYTKVHQEMWVGFTIMGYLYYKLSYGGKKAAVKDKSSGHH
ncbi:hypothetical protein NDU88_005525 [Pleurodeles waltl]|uniref:Uncharacterized protein n=1 Tax=Pleurodeles waltl TaxID=8319 RepID=A0AAV7MWM9_PLEWA|nr:hypothetical protein NDU88_005525 [Pleurodeles waltl]